MFLAIEMVVCILEVLQEKSLLWQLLFFFSLLACILLLYSLVGLAVNGEGKAVIIAPKTSPICCLTDIKE